MPDRAVLRAYPRPLLREREHGDADRVPDRVGRTQRRERDLHVIDRLLRLGTGAARPHGDHGGRDTAVAAHGPHWSGPRLLGNVLPSAGAEKSVVHVPGSRVTPQPPELRMTGVWMIGPR